MMVVVIIGVALTVAVPKLFPSDETLTRGEGEAVLALLPPQQGAFRKEDGELVVDASGTPVVKP